MNMIDWKSNQPSVSPKSGVDLCRFEKNSKKKVQIIKLIDFHLSTVEIDLNIYKKSTSIDWCSLLGKDFNYITPLIQI